MEKQLDLFSSSKPTKIKHDFWYIFTDGAARGNPGPAGAGVFITHNEEPPIKEAIFLGEKTNNQAEYLALAYALFLMQKIVVEKNCTKKSELLIHADSELLVKQMTGKYKIKNETLFFIKNNLEKFLDSLTYRFIHIPREQNKEADKLANLAIDKKKKIPTDFSKFLADCKLN